MFGNGDGVLLGYVGGPEPAGRLAVFERIRTRGSRGAPEPPFGTSS